MHEDEIILRVVIDNVINGLSKLEKQAVDLYVNQGYKPMEIADELGISRTNVYNNLRKFRVLLKEELCS